MNEIHQISILGGHGKNVREPDRVAQIDLRMGDIISIVGPTGSGKTTLINDIELFANGDTPTGRRILIDGQPAPASYRNDPGNNPIALITQHTNFLSDLPVQVFLETHAGIRCADPARVQQMIEDTLAFANQLTGEPVIPGNRMTELSGGQTRALLIADATVICDTPIVLLDEVENAGIHRARALELLRQHRKIFIFVTHDPRIALLSDLRIVMGGGCIRDLIVTDDAERAFARTVGLFDDALTRWRETIRMGGRLGREESAQAQKLAALAEEVMA